MRPRAASQLVPPAPADPGISKGSGAQSPEVPVALSRCTIAFSGPSTGRDLLSHGTGAIART